VKTRCRPLLRAELSAIALIAAMLSWSKPHSWAAEVQFEVATARTVSAVISHRWLEIFKREAPSGPRIYVGNGTEQPAVEKRTSGIYHVRAVINAKGQLLLPGATLTLSDQDKLRRWIEQIDQQLPQPEQPQLVAAGLTAEQLASVRKRLSTPVDQSTRNRQALDVLRIIGKTIPGKIAITAKAKMSLQESWTVTEELEGVASGTAMAAAIRPLGLVLSPEVDKDGQVQLRIATVGETQNHWPIGWATREAPEKLVPKFVDRLDVDIEPLPVGEVVDAIVARLDVPVVWDHNGMARERIDPKFDEVSHPAATALYFQVLRRVLDKAHLKYELRVDDADKVFLWIAPIAKAK
jgi:hypothetical protein